MLGMTGYDLLKNSRDPHHTLWNLFPCNGSRGIAGTQEPLIEAFLTFLEDRLFLSWGFNHVVGDASAIWQFVKCWSDYAEHGSSSCCYRNFKRRDPPGFEQCNFKPFDPDFIKSLLIDPLRKLPRPPSDLRVAFFHFPYDRVQSLFMEANDNLGRVSRYKAVMARMWKAMVLASGKTGKEPTQYLISIGFRGNAMEGKFGQGFLGNAQDCVHVWETCESVAQKSLRQLALKIAQTLAPAQKHEAVLRRYTDYPNEGDFDYGTNKGCYLFSAHDPRVSVYTNTFGLGRRPTSVRSGMSSKSNGMTVVYEGCEEGNKKGFGLEVCFKSQILNRIIQDDHDFMSYVILDENMNGM